MAGTPFSLERSRVIAAPPERIYPLVADFRAWTAWSPWEGLDPDLKRTYGGPESGVGATYAWEGNRRAGSGSMEILQATEPSDVRIRLLFRRPWKADNQTTFELRPEGAGTRVTWRMTGENAGMARIFARVLNMDKLVGKDFEKGLARLAECAS